MLRSTLRGPIVKAAGARFVYSPIMQQSSRAEAEDLGGLNPQPDGTTSTPETVSWKFGDGGHRFLVYTFLRPVRSTLFSSRRVQGYNGQRTSAAGIALGESVLH